MLFSSITLNNFKAFIGQHTFDLITKPGSLHFLSSVNKVEPNLEANGCGKSTIWDALFWVIFGCTLRGVKAANVRSWGVKGSCTVTLPFVIDEVPYSLFRSWSPNKIQLKVGDEEVRDIDQDELDKLIGLNSDAFQNSIVMGQFSKMFFDMKPAEKMALFTDVLDLEDWEQRSKTSSSLAKAVSFKLSDAQNNTTAITSRIETIEEQIGVAEKGAKKFKKQAKTEIKENNAAKDSLTKKLEKAIKVKEKTQKDFDKANEDVKGLTIDTKKDELALNKSREKASSINTSIAVNQTQTSAIGKQLEKLLAVKGSCPVCKQKITKAHTDAEKKKLVNERGLLFAELGGLSKKMDKAKKKNRELQDKFNATRSVEKKFNEAQYLQRTELRKATDRVIQCERDIRQIENNIEKAGNRANPYKDQLKDLDKKIGLAETNLEELTTKVEQLTEMLTAYEFWVKGFKEIRLMLIDEALLSLEIEVNNNLAQLGLPDWQIGFEVERETQAGGVSKGFTVYVISPRNEDLVPWECWSGGETQRLSLAGTMGLCNLILNQRGITTNLEVYDEPTAHISEKGVVQLADLLQQRSQETGKQVWLVDHRTVEYGEFESIVKIVKDENGARVT